MFTCVEENSNRKNFIHEEQLYLKMQPLEYEKTILKLNSITVSNIKSKLNRAIVLVLAMVKKINFF